MKNLLLISVLVAFQIEANFAQVISASSLPQSFGTFKNFQQSINSLNTSYSGDTTWLYTFDKTYEFLQGEYKLKYQGVTTYYLNPENIDYGKMKTYTGLDPITNDSVRKHSVVYDNKGRDDEITLQFYDTVQNSWDNYSLTKIYYDQYGYDSCSVYKVWSDDSGEWIDNQRHILYRNYQQAIIFDVYEIWTGIEWDRDTGNKFEYFNNPFECTDSIHIFQWIPNMSDWKMVHKWYLYYDENNVQTWGRDVVFDQQLQKWRNYQQTLDYVFNNWCECGIGYWNCEPNPTHFVIQNWYDTAWLNVERFNAEYDTLGGNLTVMEGFDGINWYNWKKIEKRFLADGNFDFLLNYVWQNGNWIADQGYKSVYIYINDTLTEDYNNRWDTEIADWSPYFLHEYKNYIALANVNSVGDFNKNDDEILSLLPNPATGNLIIQLSGEKQRIETVELIDQIGRIVLTIQNPAYKNTVETNVSDLNPGVYIVNIITSKKEVFRGKFIKK